MTDPGLSTFGAAARHEQARRHLTSFMALMRHDYQRARHLELLCVYLEALARGDIRRLMVMMPPRHGKSLHVSQALPAWYLGQHPDRQVILASYAAELAEQNSRAARAFVTDPRYPYDVQLAADAAAVGHWRTTAGGAVIAAGVGGGITGFGADLLVIDDPLKDRAEADSDLARERVMDWFTDVAMTRLMAGGRVLLAMTRWHEDDLAGRILAGPGGQDWTVVRLPALAEADDPLRRQVGEALWPQRFPREVLLAHLTEGMSSRSFAAMYQQQPTPESGGLLRRDWLSRRYDTAPAPVRVVQAVDSAFKTGVANDYSVIATWATDGRDYYLQDVWRGRVEYPGLIREIQAQAARHHPNEIVIEDAASGQSAIQQLRHETRLPVIPVRPEGSKESRLAAVSGLFEAGKVLLPTAAPWLGDWVEEHVAFPQGRHDDMVDTTSLALGRLHTPDEGPRLRVLRSRAPVRRPFG